MLCLLIKISFKIFSQTKNVNPQIIHSSYISILKTTKSREKNVTI